MDKNVLAAVRQLENALDAAIEQCGSTAELNAYFIMEQKVWSACGTCAQDLFWANKASAKTETASEEAAQERSNEIVVLNYKKIIAEVQAELGVEQAASSEEILKAMEKKEAYRKKCKSTLELLRSH